ncbi:MAG: class I SAM-dependent methyltransferase [Candidatus Eisenbacteria bacterium]|uniref:Class I SAM-dependent methyltransferase n=1 Tax=Eiseniibacteriota bacterium TaxID=2212470 RepID=A0A956LWI4_UNCEI|nr:class I SAM-dependent methyltransferase [Candidatus Eisenbacteria bacterium]
MSDSNYFESPLAAASYAAARPHLHAQALSRFVSFSGLQIPLEVALDIGCGTGQSTQALIRIATRVVGVDPSCAMLRETIPQAGIEYRLGSGEDIPAESGRFSLALASCVFHWVDQEIFLREIHRVLRSDGWLIVFACWFTAEMRDVPEFASWYRGEFLRRYPTPARHSKVLTDGWAREHGFAMRGEEEWTQEVSMSLERFARYKLSTTNLIATFGDDGARFDEAKRWLVGALSPYFLDIPERRVVFGARSVYLQRLADGAPRRDGEDESRRISIVRRNGSARSSRVGPESR